MTPSVLFSPVHEPRTVAFHLMAGRNSTKCYLPECPTRRSWERAVRDTTYTLIIPRIHDPDRPMAPLEDQASNVLLGHVWELFRIDVLQVGKPASPNMLNKPMAETKVVHVVSSTSICAFDVC